MKVLHLFSNTKWTGPAEPVVHLCWMLAERGLDVTIACAGGAGTIDSTVVERARAKGLRTVQSLCLRKHFNARHNLHDVWLLRRYIQAEKFDLVHTHLDNDHLVGGFAARNTRRFPLIVRTSYQGDGIAPGLRNRILLHRYTDGLITCSHRAAIADTANFALAADRVWTVYGSVDAARFDPTRKLPDIRSRFRLTRDHFVVGVVARIQTHRKFDILLEAAAIASKHITNLRVMIIGRGTHMGQVAVEPSRRLLLENCVVLPGYLQGDEFVAIVNALDAKVFLMPGTDGTCRALLEAMALAKPCIVADRGVLPEIVTHDVNGLVIRDDPTSLAEAILRLARDSTLRRELGRSARKKVVADFSLAKQASLIEDIYRSLARMGSRNTRSPSSS